VVEINIYGDQQVSELRFCSDYLASLSDLSISNSCSKKSEGKSCSSVILVASQSHSNTAYNYDVPTTTTAIIVMCVWYCTCRIFGRDSSHKAQEERDSH